MPLHAPGSWKLTQIQHKNRKERYFNRKLISARVVSEHAYGMLKRRCRFVYKKAECKRHNLKAVIMACINCTSHLCIVRSNPCLPRWRLRVERLNLIEADKSARNWLSLEEYKGWRHHQVGTCVHWRLCQKFDFDCSHNRYNYESEEFSYYRIFLFKLQSAWQ